MIGYTPLSDTVKPRSIRTPRYYGQFALSPGKESSYIFSKLILSNGEKKSLRHFAVVAKF